MRGTVGSAAGFSSLRRTPVSRLRDQERKLMFNRQLTVVTLLDYQNLATLSILHVLGPSSFSTTERNQKTTSI